MRGSSDIDKSLGNMLGLKTVTAFKQGRDWNLRHTDLYRLSQVPPVSRN